MITSAPSDAGPLRPQPRLSLSSSYTSHPAMPPRKKPRTAAPTPSPAARTPTLIRSANRASSHSMPRHTQTQIQSFFTKQRKTAVSPPAPKPVKQEPICLDDDGEQDGDAASRPGPSRLPESSRARRPDATSTSTSSPSMSMLGRAPTSTLRAAAQAPGRGHQTPVSSTTTTTTTTAASSSRRMTLTSPRCDAEEEQQWLKRAKALTGRAKQRRSDEGSEGAGGGGDDDGGGSRPRHPRVRREEDDERDGTSRATSGKNSLQRTASASSKARMPSPPATPPQATPPATPPQPRDDGGRESYQATPFMYESLSGLSMLPWETDAALKAADYRISAGLEPTERDIEARERVERERATRAHREALERSSAGGAAAGVRRVEYGRKATVAKTRRGDVNAVDGRRASATNSGDAADGVEVDCRESPVPKDGDADDRVVIDSRRPPVSKSGDANDGADAIDTDARPPQRASSPSPSPSSRAGQDGQRRALAELRPQDRQDIHTSKRPALAELHPISNNRGGMDIDVDGDNADGSGAAIDASLPALTSTSTPPQQQLRVPFKPMFQSPPASPAKGGDPTAMTSTATTTPSSSPLDPPSAQPPPQPLRTGYALRHGTKATPTGGGRTGTGVISRTASGAADSPRTPTAFDVSPLLRSPRTNRRIYALETQVSGGACSPASAASAAAAPFALPKSKSTTAATTSLKDVLLSKHASPRKSKSASTAAVKKPPAAMPTRRTSSSSSSLSSPPPAAAAASSDETQPLGSDDYDYDDDFDQGERFSDDGDDDGDATVLAPGPLQAQRKRSVSPDDEATQPLPFEDGGGGSSHGDDDHADAVMTADTADADADEATQPLAFPPGDSETEEEDGDDDPRQQPLYAPRSGKQTTGWSRVNDAWRGVDLAKPTAVTTTTTSVPTSSFSSSRRRGLNGDDVDDARQSTLGKHGFDGRRPQRKQRRMQGTFFSRDARDVLSDDDEGGDGGDGGEHARDDGNHVVVDDDAAADDDATQPLPFPTQSSHTESEEELIPPARTHAHAQRRSDSSDGSSSTSWLPSSQELHKEEWRGVREFLRGL